MPVQLTFLWRNWIVFKQYIPIYLAFSVFQPFVMLYGFTFAFGESRGQVTEFLLSGFMVYAAVAGSFMGSAYQFYEHIESKRVVSWCAASVSLPHALAATTLWQALRSLLSVLCLLLMAWIPSQHIIGQQFFLVCSIVFCFACVSALFGCALACWAERIDKIYLSDIIVYILFVFSGIFVDVRTFPEFFQYIAWLLPTWHTVEIVRPLFSGLSLDFGTFSLHAGVLLFQGVCAYFTALYFLQKRILD